MKYKYLFDEIKEYVKSKNVLHIGCVGSWNDNSINNFEMHKFLDKYTQKLHGIDIDMEGIAKMNNEGISNIYSDLNQLDKSYDVIAPLSVLNFVDSPIDFLNLYKTKLNRGGVYCV